MRDIYSLIPKKLQDTLEAGVTGSMEDNEIPIDSHISVRKWAKEHNVSPAEINKAFEQACKKLQACTGGEMETSPPWPNEETSEALKRFRVLSGLWFFEGRSR